jgi:polar amino acid transport system substrate-binding protein
MNTHFKCPLFILLLLLSPLGLAKEIKVAVGLALPPYVISSENKGMELDIIKETLAMNGHTVKPVYLPFARVPWSLKEGKVDAAMTINESSGIDNVFYSDNHIIYQNVAVSLAKNNFTIDTVKDLTDRSVLAFQSATLYLGDDFKNMASNNKRYKEEPRQDIQITMVYNERTEAVVMDLNIFKYYKAKESRADVSQQVKIHTIFSPSLYKVGFRSKKLRDDFNVSLKELIVSGKHKEIIKRYVSDD